MVLGLSRHAFKSLLVYSKPQYSMGLHSGAIASKRTLKMRTINSADSLNDPSRAASRKLGKRRRLTPEERVNEFNKLYEYIVARTGTSPSVQTPMKHSVWPNLISLATSEEQLELITKIFPKWTERGNDLRQSASEGFILRCEQLGCPRLALNVLCDYRKYNVPMTLPGAHQLLHSLHMKYPLEDTIMASALFSVYRLPPIAQDLVSCSLVLAACFRSPSPASKKISEALTTALETLLKNQNPAEMSIGKNPRQKRQERSKLWVRWALGKINKALMNVEGKRAEWLHDWRLAAGHIKPQTT